MAPGLGLTGIVASAAASGPTMMNTLFGTPLAWVVMLAPLGFVFFLSFGLRRMSFFAAQATFWAFAAVMGLSMATIFTVFTGQSIARVFFITAGAFAGTSLWGYTTKRDLSSMGSFLFMGLIGIVIASLVNIFLHSSALQFVVSIIGVIVFFTGLPLLATDVLVWKDTGIWEPMAIGQLWQYLNYQSMVFIQLLVEQDITPFAWDPVIVRFLVCWAFAALMGLGILIVVLSHRRTRRRDLIHVIPHASSAIN